MIVKRYVVKDMPEAVVSIRKDLGKNAVILSTKKVRVKKWLGLMWNTRLEVTAAVGDDIPLYRGKSSLPKPMREQPAANEKAHVHSKAVIDESRGFAATLSSAVQAYQSAATASPAQTQAEAPQIGAVLEELASLRSILLSRSYTEAEEPALLSNVRRFLRGQGMDEGYIEKLLHDSRAGIENTMTLKQALARVCDAIARDLGHCTDPLPIASDSRVVAFVGPTGVGKTTTIAKIASLHVLAGQRRVGLLTTDTYRIAAVQQLQTYADILDVPLVVAKDVTDVRASLEKLGNCDLILVDTAGRNFRTGETVTYTKTLLQALTPDETMLVLSLTAKPDDMERLVGACAALDIDKFLFTKLDETDSVGSIPRLLAKYNIPMSYVTTGQSVPDDIDMLSVPSLLERWGEGPSVE